MNGDLDYTDDQVGHRHVPTWKLTNCAKLQHFMTAIMPRCRLDEVEAYAKLFVDAARSF